MTSPLTTEQLDEWEKLAEDVNVANREIVESDEGYCTYTREIEGVCTAVPLLIAEVRRLRLATQPSDEHPIFAFLLGSAPFDGVWFSERHPTEKGAYWWRKHLRAAISAYQNATAGDPRGDSEPHPREVK